MKLKTSADLVDYQEALSFMEERVAKIFNGSEEECVWLLEHPPLYTAGTSAKAEDLLNAQFPVYDTGRGGEYTYHGPGQRVAYIMLNLKERYKEPDIKHFIWSLEEWIILTLKEFGITGERREGRVGIWVVNKDKSEDKIAAIGIRIRRWVSFHGISINLNPDLSHFEGIVPCGIKGHGVTSFEKLGVKATMEDLDKALQKTWPEVFGV
jgi:lipoyl(octanoyl) transferase